MHPLLLRFDDPRQESAFREAHDRAAVPALRLAAVLGAALYGLFGILDAWLVPGDVEELLAVRAVVICWLLLSLVATYRPWFRRVQQLVVCSSVLVAGWGLAAMQLLAPVPESFAAMGTMLLLIFLFSLVRVRIVAASVTAALVIAGYEAMLLVSQPGPLTSVYLNFELLGFVLAGIAVCHTLERLWRIDFLRRGELERERARSDALLHNVLPEPIARRLKADPLAIADAAEEVTVLFADIAGFTPLTERTDPRLLVGFLDRLFIRYDELCDLHGAEKIKTIGDGYMAAAGLPDPQRDPAAIIADLALSIRDATKEVAEPGIGPLEVRIGICSGPVVAGVIGRRKFAYDLWGDTVNTASRLESHGRAGVIQVCGETRRLLGERYVLEGPVEVTLKGKGPITAWRLIDRRGATAAPRVPRPAPAAS